MTIASMSALAVLGVLGLSACGSEEPSGIPLYTPSATSTSTPTPSPSSKWTSEQQQVIDGYGRFIALGDAMQSKTENLDKGKLRKVAKEPFATAAFDDIRQRLGHRWAQKGKTVNTISVVTIGGDAATLKTCVDYSRSKIFEQGNPSNTMTNPAPSIATVSLAHVGASWLVAGISGGEGKCVSG